MTPSEERWQRLRDLFDKLVDIPAEQRRIFWESQTDTDVQLRQEVEGMLAHASQSGNRLAEVIGGVADTLVPGSPWLNRRFGPYRIIREIGRGGMGIVFEAERDDQEYRKRVALKVAPGWRDLVGLSDRFRQERQILAELEHPNIARFLDGGSEQGLPYFAMELVDGTPITKHCRAQQLSIRQRLELFLQVGSALHYAHQHLVVHRDIKPSNIMVTPDGVPKLLDFGIAKILEDRLESGSTTGQMMWTPDYASPEQVRGGAVTTRTDVYALGLLLFEMLTGQKGQTADTSSPLALDKSVCETESPPASQTAAHAGDADTAKQLQGDLDTIVAKAVRKEPGQRYESVAEMMDDIHRYLNGEVVLARPATVAYRAGKFLRRNRFAVLAGSLLAISIAVGLAATLAQMKRAERRFNEVRKLAGTFVFEFDDKIKDLAGSTPARSFVVETATQYLDSLSRESSGDLRLMAEVGAAYVNVGMIQGSPTAPNLGEPDKALISFEKAIQLSRQVLSRQPQQRTALQTLTQALTFKGLLLISARHENALGMKALQEARQSSDVLVHLPNPALADQRVIMTVQRIYADMLLQSKPKEAIPYYENVHRASESAFQETKDVMHRVMGAGALIGLARAQRDLGNSLEWARRFEEAAAIIEPIYIANPGNDSTRRQLSLVYQGLASAYSDRGLFHINQPQKAVEVLRKSEKMASTDSNNVDSLSEKVYLELGFSEAFSSIDGAQALNHAKTALETVNQMLQKNPKSMDAVRLRENVDQRLGNLYMDSGQAALAVPILQRSRLVDLQLLAKDPDDLAGLDGLAQNDISLGKAYTALGRWEDAMKSLNDAETAGAKLAAKYSDDLFFIRDHAWALEAFGDYYRTRGDLSKSASYYQQSLEVWKRWSKIAPPGPYPQLHITALQRKLSDPKAPVNGTIAR